MLYHLTKKNIEYFESWIDSVDAVIIPEATCSAMINKDWEHFLHDQPEWKERAIKLSNKIFLATKWLENNTNIKLSLTDLWTIREQCISDLGASK